MNIFYANGKRSALIEQAMQLAIMAHATQLDKGGHAYIFHPFRVMMTLYYALAKRGRVAQDSTVLIPAILHDVVEDTDVKLDDLREVFDNTTVDTIAKLTLSAGQSRDDYFRNIFDNPSSLVARMVKLADMLDNTDPRRMEFLPSEKRTSLLKKYRSDFKHIERYFSKRDFSFQLLFPVYAAVEKDLYLLLKKRLHSK